MAPEPKAAAASSLAGRDKLFGELLFRARDLAWKRSASEMKIPIVDSCFECGRRAVNGRIQHTLLCLSGAVLDVVDRICASSLEELAPSDPIASPTPYSEPRKEEVQQEEPVRVEAWESPRDEQLSREALRRLRVCEEFCEGIPTEVLERELPLASDQRMRWHELTHLRLALPFLAELRDKEVRS